MRIAWIAALCCSLSFGCLVDTSGDLTTGSGDVDAGPGGGGGGDCDDGDMNTYYPDLDNDGYGDSTGAADDCSAPVGYVLDNTDCNDTEPNVYPGAPELCGDKLDNSCAVGTDACLPNLTAQWTFEDIVGPNAVDFSGKGHTGILQGGLVHTPGPTLTFDGIDDYVEVTDALEFQLSAGTVAFWFMPTAIGVEQSMLSKDSNGNDAGGHLSFYLNANGTVRVRLQSNNDTFEIVGPTPVLAGQWTHVAFAFGGTEGMKLYVNGQPAGINLYTGGLLRNEEPLVIGAGTDNSGNLTAEPINKVFAGQIADVELFDRKLQLTEILSLRMVNAPLGATL